MGATIQRPGEGEDIRVGDSVLSFRATEDSGSPVAIFEATVAPDYPSPPMHVHHQMHDIFYVVEGTLTIHLGDDAVEAPAGSLVHVPPGTPHTFSNRSGETVRTLNIMSPAGFENYFRELGQALKESGGMPTPERIAKLAAGYDYEPVGPPPGA